MTSLISAIGIMVCFYYGMTGLACAYYYRKVLRSNKKTLLMKGIWPVSSAIFLLILAVIQIPSLGWSVSLFTLGAIAIGCLPMVYYRFKYHSSFYFDPPQWHNPQSRPRVERSLEQV
jgi:amino acid transporter